MQMSYLQASTKLVTIWSIRERINNQDDWTWNQARPDGVGTPSHFSS